MKEKFSYLLFKILIQIAMIVFSLSILFGIYFLLVNSFKTPGDFGKNQFSLPLNFNFDNIISVWDKGGLDIAFKNSVILSISSVIIILIVGIFGAYAFSFLRFKFKKPIYLTIIATMYFSPTLLILPLMLEFSRLGLNNNYIGVITIFVGLKLAFSIFLLTTYFRGVPKEIIEAATIDGASRFNIIRNIIIPLSVPAIISLALLNFNSIWNDLLIGVIFLQKPALRPIMVAIAQYQGQEFNEITKIFAASLIATLPILILYGFAQKYFTKGMTLGSLK